VKPPLLLPEFVREKRRGVLIKLPADPPVVSKKGWHYAKPWEKAQILAVVFRQDLQEFSGLTWKACLVL
jgi:hypothetical protein